MKYCKLCGKPFTPTKNAQTVCNDVHYRKCEVCGTPFVIKLPSSSQLCCSKACTVKKRESTIMERFGVPHALQNPDLLKKAEQTTFKHYGVKHAAQSDVVKQKTKDQFIAKFGVTTPFLMDDFWDKTKATCLDKYGVEFVTQSAEFKQRGEQTCLDKYGVRRPMQSSEIHKKSWNTRKNIRGIDGTPLDSTWEKFVYDFWIGLNLPVERNIPISFEYDGKDHTTFIDFRVAGILFEVKGKPYLDGVYDYMASVPIEQKLEIYRKNHVVIITSEDSRNLFGHKDSTESNGLKHLNICPNPLIGVDVALFMEQPEFPYADNRPKCFYDVSVNGKPTQYQAFHDKKLRWEIIKNRIQYVGGFIDPKEILVGLNVTRKAKQPSWFSETYAKKLISKYCTSDVIVDPFAGWGTRCDAARKLGKEYIGCDLNAELVAWHRQYDRNIICGDARDFKYTECCSVFICPPYGDTEIYMRDQTILSECEWLDIVIKNIPNAKEYVMVCHDVTDKYKPFIVETKNNRSHFNTNTEYVVVVPHKIKS